MLTDSILAKVAKDVHNDRRTRQLAEEYQSKYGTIKKEDLMEIFSI